MTLIVDKSVLTTEELVLMNDMANHPEAYLTHLWTKHNDLCKRHGHCVLCASGSHITFY
jgi:hypothetical protein